MSPSLRKPLSTVFGELVGVVRVEAERPQRRPFLSPGNDDGTVRWQRGWRWAKVFPQRVRGGGLGNEGEGDAEDTLIFLA